jgi:hypothetical protein
MSALVESTRRCRVLEAVGFIAVGALLLVWRPDFTSSWVVVALETRFRGAVLGILEARDDYGCGAVSRVNSSCIRQVRGTGLRAQSLGWVLLRPLQE